MKNKLKMLFIIKENLKIKLNKDLYEIKLDLINNTLLSNKKYHTWINLHKDNIFPYLFTDSYGFDIKNNPYKYMKGMIYMCLELEKIGTKTFQFFPLRTNIVPKYIPIDTKSLIEIIVDDTILLKLDIPTKKCLLDNLTTYKNDIWSCMFDLNNSVFKQSCYSFDYRINTDCHGMFIQLIHNDFIEKEQNKKNKYETKKRFE